jgi:hypothetical protein
MVPGRWSTGLDDGLVGECKIDAEAEEDASDGEALEH